MSRSLSLCAFVAALVAALPPGSLAPVGTAAPVPKHLMKGPAFTFPTTVGTKWVYAVGDVEQVHVITKAEQKDDVTVVTIDTEGADGKLTPRHEFSIGPNEWCLYSEGGNKYDPPWTFLKLPLGKEQKLELTTTRPDLGSKIFSAKTQSATTEEVKVPAGTFNAVKIDCAFSLGGDRLGGKPMTYTAWYAPGVGMVKREDPPTTVLKSFTLGKGKN